MKPLKTIFLTLAVTFSFTACEKNPTEGFKVEGSIENFQDCSSSSVKAFVTDDYKLDFVAKISESKLNNNYFSMFLPYELKDKYCSAIDIKRWILFDPNFESYLTISNKNVKISRVLFNSDKNYFNNITQFGYREEFYNNDVASVTLVKTQYIYAQSAVSVTGEYETRLTHVMGTDYYKTVKMDLFLQKGWNIIYHIGNFVSKPNTYRWEIDTAIINITTEKPENIELKWYYRIRDTIMGDKDIFLDAQFVYMSFMDAYYFDFIVNF